MAIINKFSALDLMQARVKSVPEDWTFSYVGKTFTIKNNLRKPISENERVKNPGKYPYYGPTKVQGYIGSYEQEGKYALIGEDGDHFLKYQKQSMTQLVEGKCTVNNHAHIIEGTTASTREWFYYYFMHRDIFSFLSRQGAGRYKLNKASLEKIPLLVPPLPEQEKIAQILSTWDKAIDTSEKLLANSRQQKKALMQQLLTGKKRLRDKNGVRFSGEWINTAIDSFIKESRVPGNSGETAKKITIKLYGRGVVPKEEKRAGSNSTKYYKRSAGQFIYSKLDFLNGAFGIIPNELDGYESTLDLPAFDFLSGFNTSWFFYYISREEFYSANLGLANGGRKARRVNPNDLLKIKIPTPNVEEQQKIAATLSSADREIETLQQKLDGLKQEKKALMQQLLTGKRRVQVEEAQ
ncbi:restriction endonuclease subunit S [Microbulbifer sp. SSSA008]|uniref:restriction endonuclease subunit S n=1 Tax=Microbulbifer sp. SSSA008 TaxID=3243380 RepID=UPI004039B84F